MNFRRFRPSGVRPRTTLRSKARKSPAPPDEWSDPSGGTPGPKTAESRPKTAAPSGFEAGAGPPPSRRRKQYPYRWLHSTTEPKAARPALSAERNETGHPQGWQRTRSAGERQLLRLTPPLWTGSEWSHRLRGKIVRAFEAPGLREIVRPGRGGAGSRRPPPDTARKTPRPDFAIRPAT